MTRKQLLIGGGVVAVAALLVVGQLLTSRGARVAPPTSATASAQGGAAGAGSAGGNISTTSAGGPGSASQRVRPPGPRLKAVAPAGPLPAGQPLPPLSSSPPDLISAVATSVVPAGSAYRVTMRPWGTGPAAATGPTVVATIYSAEAVGGAPGHMDLRGHVLLLRMDAARGGSLEYGGTYAGVVTFVPSGRVLVPTLSGARLTQQ